LTETRREKYGKLYSLYTVQGYDWDQLSPEERTQIEHMLHRRKPYGSPGEFYGFADTRKNEDIYYGHFTQQFLEELTERPTLLDRPQVKVEHSYADRFYLFVPRRNLMVLERRNFLRQPGLTPQVTEEKIEKCLKTALSRYEIRLEKFSHEMSLEEMRAFFRTFPVVGVQVSGLRGRQVPGDFIFFNPQYDKNVISRELFETKILPFTDALDVFSDAYKDRSVSPAPAEDLRGNPLARLAVEIAPDIRQIAIHHPKGGRQYIRPRYDDTIRATSGTSDIERLSADIVQRVNEIPDMQIDISIKIPRQITLFDEGE